MIVSPSSAKPLSAPLSGPQPDRILSVNRTALSKSLAPHQQAWLLNYCIDRWTALYASMGTWRTKMAKYEKLSEDDYGDRKTANPDPSITDAVKSIFAKQNNTLGILSGTVDFVKAQAIDDLFGTRPWVGATPQGASDVTLADRLTKYSQWKFDQSNIEESLIDAVKLACDLGTVFVKPRWVKDIETFEENKDVAHRNGKPLLDAAGEYVTTMEKLQEIMAASQQPPGSPTPDQDPLGELEEASEVQAQEAEPLDPIDGSEITWVEMNIEQTQEVYNNVAVDCIDYKSIAFDLTAQEMDLTKTPVFHKFRMGVLDAISFYGLDEMQAHHLRNCVAIHGRTEARDFRGEVYTDEVSTELDANPQIELVEGFLRCDPFQKGNAARINIVFIPELAVILSCDYLANVTPAGILPIFPIRCFKTPRRIIGRGYWERYEDGDTAIDTLFNSTTYCDRMARFAIKAFDPMQFKGKVEAKDFLADPDKVWELAPDGTLAKGLQFLGIPDVANRSDELLQQLVQTHQARTGVTSAAQGEMKGMPQSNTATGVNQIISRGAVLIKWPIDQIKKDIQRPVEYSVHLGIANLDREEEFTWGEGKDAEILALTPGDVKGLKANVVLTMTESQNTDRLQDAKAGMETLVSYSELPPEEKPAGRKLAVQIFSSLGFPNAEMMIAEPQPPVPPAPPEDPIKESMSYKDVPDDIRRQMEQKAGFQPSTLPPPVAEVSTSANGKETKPLPPS